MQKIFFGINKFLKNSVCNKGSVTNNFYNKNTKKNNFC